MIGIDDIAIYIPKTYLEIEELAFNRGIDPNKLRHGLGLEKMAVCPQNEDAVTMAAEACAQLIKRNALSLSEIGKIYIGTESSIDGAKPIASYVLSMLTSYFGLEKAPTNIDVIDMTFACIGGVDALENVMNWIGAKDDRIGIVICTDEAKYVLESSGEYTQGAGAVAMIIKNNPRLLELRDAWGVSSKGVHDFYKPLRSVSKKKLVKSILAQLDIVQTIDEHAVSRLEIPEIIEKHSNKIDIHTMTPIYDGQFSNQCYISRLKEAINHYKKENQIENVTSYWHKLAFHLPYAAHGKRIFIEIFYEENKRLFDEEIVAIEDVKIRNKAISKSKLYKSFYIDKIYQGSIASSQIGNMYTASIFASLMSLLLNAYQQGEELTNKIIGFCSYGSGSKSKVFSAKVKENWKEVVATFELEQKLSNRTKISFQQYEKNHIGASINYEKDQGFYLAKVSKEYERYYKYKK